MNQEVLKAAHDLAMIKVRAYLDWWRYHPSNGTVWDGAAIAECDLEVERALAKTAAQRFEQWWEAEGKYYKW